MLDASAVRELLIEKHAEAFTEPGDYDGYARTMFAEFQVLLNDLELLGFWVLSSSDGNYVDNLEIGCPNGERLLIPDIGNWGEDDGSQPTYVDDTVKFFLNLVRDKKMYHISPKNRRVLKIYPGILTKHKSDPGNIDALSIEGIMEMDRKGWEPFLRVPTSEGLDIYFRKKES